VKKTLKKPYQFLVESLASMGAGFWAFPSWWSTPMLILGGMLLAMALHRFLYEQSGCCPDAGERC